MPAGRPRIHENAADKQFMYRQRQKEIQQNEHDLASRMRDILDAAIGRGVIPDSKAPLWVQLEQLKEWIGNH